MFKFFVNDYMGVPRDFELEASTSGIQLAIDSLPVVLASDQPALITKDHVLELDGAAAQTAVVNNILEPTAGATPTDVADYRCASVQVVSTGTAGTFIFEQSNDGINWRPLPLLNAEVTTGAIISGAITATASQIIYTFPIRARWLRLRIATTITGGSIRAFSRFSTEPWVPTANTVVNPTAGNLFASTIATTTNTGTGLTVTHLAAAIGSNNAAVVKGSAGRIYKVTGYNAAAAVRFLKFYNKATIPVPGTDVAVWQLALAPSKEFNLDLADIGIPFATGIGYALTTAAALNDNTAVTANDIVGLNLMWS